MNDEQIFFENENAASKLMEKISVLSTKKNNLEKELEQLSSDKLFYEWVHTITNGWENQNKYNENNIIKLNVGGTKFETTLLTLTKYPESKLGKLFISETRIKLKRDIDGNVFLDRDPESFKYILRFLRSGKIDGAYPRHALNELEFFGILSSEN